VSWGTISIFFGDKERSAERCKVCEM
jgi:hypothetical protein